MALGKRLAKRIDTVLELCGRYLSQGAVFLPHDDALEIRCGPRLCPFCRWCLKSQTTTGYCRRSALGSAYQSLQTGEPSYFRCWMGITSVAVPVAPGGKFIGAVELGGFHFPEEQRGNTEFIRRNLCNFSAGTTASAAELVERIPTISSREIRGAATFLFDSLFSSGLNDIDAFTENREKYLQQRRIAELMQSYAARSAPAGDTFGMFSALVLALRSRDRDRILLLLDDFFCRILLTSGANTDHLKAHVHVLLSVLARETVVNARTPFDSTMARHYRAFRELEELHDAEDICYWAFKRLEQHLQAPAGAEPAAEELSTRALEWIQAHFAEKVKLQDLADAVNASVSRVVHTLRRETGKTFHGHLLSMRLREARYLLVNTDLPLYEIAAECGFYDQSHFCRTFKSAVSQTPGQFRKGA